MLAGLQSRVPRDLNRRLAGRASGFAWPAAKSPLQPCGLAAQPDTKTRLRETRKNTNLVVRGQGLGVLTQSSREALCLSAPLPLCVKDILI